MERSIRGRYCRFLEVVFTLCCCFFSSKQIWKRNLKEESHPCDYIVIYCGCWIWEAAVIAEVLPTDGTDAFEVPPGALLPAAVVAFEALFAVAGSTKYAALLRLNPGIWNGVKLFSGLEFAAASASADTGSAVGFSFSLGRIGMGYDFQETFSTVLFCNNSVIAVNSIELMSYYSFAFSHLSKHLRRYISNAAYPSSSNRFRMLYSLRFFSGFFSKYSWISSGTTTSALHLLFF